MFDTEVDLFGVGVVLNRVKHTKCSAEEVDAEKGRRTGGKSGTSVRTRSNLLSVVKSVLDLVQREEKHTT